MRITFLFIFCLSFQVFAADEGSSLEKKESTASPQELTRRLYLDLYERLPDINEYDKSVAMIKKGKYKDLVKKMLSADEFRFTLAKKIVKHYSSTMNRNQAFGESFLVEHVKKTYTGKNADFRKFLKDFTTANGIPYSNPMVSFYATDELAPDLAGRYAERVLGLPYGCARCHDHKDHDEIKQKDFWELASYFNATNKARVQQKRQLTFIKSRLDRGEPEKLFGKDNYSKIKEWFKAEEAGKNIYLTKYTGGEMMMRRMGGNPDRVKAPQILLFENTVDMGRLKIRYKVEKEVKETKPQLPGKKSFAKGTGRPREMLADWVTSASNPYTYKAVTNWVTHWIMGRGWVMPVTDIYGGVGDAKAQLTSYSNRFANNKYRIVKLVESLLNSR